MNLRVTSRGKLSQTNSTLANLQNSSALNTNINMNRASQQSPGLSVWNLFSTNRNVVFPFIIVIGTLVTFSLTIWNFTSIESKFSGFEHRTYPRLDLYCAREQKIGEEQHAMKWIASKEFQLSNLVIAIRHGDRSSIHKIPNSHPKSTAKVSDYLAPEALQYTDYLSSLKLHVIGSSTEKSVS